MKGPSLLASWLKKRDCSHEQFAEMVGAHRTQVFRAVRGKRRPGLDLAVLIERVTGGAVPVESWTDVPPSRVRRAS